MLRDPATLPGSSLCQAHWGFLRVKTTATPDGLPANESAEFLSYSENCFTIG